MKTFRTIIFFGITNEKTLAVKDNFLNLSFVKVFDSNHLDEVDQIVSMSYKSVIFTDDPQALKLVLQKNLNGHFRQYFFDWETFYQAREVSDLRSKGVTIVKEINFNSIVEKIELYLFGMANSFKRENFTGVATNTKESRTDFFSLFELYEGRWRMTISTHEREANVSGIIGRSWEHLVEQTILNADSIKEVNEKQISGAPYYELISTFILNNITPQIIILHVNIENEADERIRKAKLFLSSL